jgi:hypothetical protein
MDVGGRSRRTNSDLSGFIWRPEFGPVAFGWVAGLLMIRHKVTVRDKDFVSKANSTAPVKFGLIFPCTVCSARGTHHLIPALL